MKVRLFSFTNLWFSKEKKHSSWMGQVANVDQPPVTFDVHWNTAVTKKRKIVNGHDEYFPKKLC